MGPIRSPLGAIGTILVLLEGIAGATLFALDSDPHLRLAIVVTIIVVFGLVTLTVLGITIYFTITNPGFLFNPADVGQLGETAQRRFFSAQDDIVFRQDSSVVVPNPPESSEQSSLMSDTPD